MGSSMLTLGPLDLDEIRSSVDSVLDAFLVDKSTTAADGCFPPEAIEIFRDFLRSGGKRMRPLLCLVGWHATAESADTEKVLRIAASLEMFHAFTLIHDDVMDNSSTRRGKPTVHRAFAHRYAARPDAMEFGTNAAILLGDLALAWSQELFHSAGLTPVQLAAALPVLDLMRTEVMYGQYLDLLTAKSFTTDLDHAMEIIRYKTAKYTVERPLHLGATIAGAEQDTKESLSSYAIPVGEAFQLRDDLLGIFGDPDITGKSAMEDLREGKGTVLVALALDRADSHQQSVLNTLLGDPDLDERGAEKIRSILLVTGACNTVEQMIADRHQAALDALGKANFSTAVTAALEQLATVATKRIS
ncbi:geranylgeranyl diphosphate synthase type I [Streptomyces sp. V4I8]|uniref:polyprenyl synthetase family protein n=1 Tax=Streptomyces sp. V4I8 TaxID=3156469 RepID=UPI0035154931